MKSNHAIRLLIAMLIASAAHSYGQSIGDIPLGQFYDHSMKEGKQPIPHLYLRESDVVWESILWRTIDLHERFNQFFYYPTEPEGSQGLLNFTNLIWNAAKNFQIPMYEDDEFKIPIDPDHYFTRYLTGDTVQLEIYDDEEGEEFHYETVVVPKIFYSEEITRYYLKEACYIEKQTTGQNFRIIGLALIKDNYKTIDGEEEYMGSFPLFWIPFESLSVRRLLVRNEAYFEDNIAHLPSWDEIFLTRTYSSFISRESNRFNRSISDYLTGEDAIMEADRIEERLLDIEQDMWEY
ncbi:MAG: gliding motility protein GldN [Bacteroidales bacterium]|nr:gliding motility protein GldN [Bacteroidales bacterium]